ncbi:MAG: hypothetical protein U0Q16_12360 [Bryobacteraceae bacterium]
MAWLALAFACELAAQRQYLTGKVMAVESLSPGVKRVRVAMPKEYRFEAGQFALVRLPKAFVDAWNAKYGTQHTEVVRPYSFALSPRRLPVVEFLVQLAGPPAGGDVPPGIASSYIHGWLKKGVAIEISAAMGGLGEIDNSAASALVMVAGGTGVAPFMGLLDHWFATGQLARRKIYLFYGARSQSELVLDTRLRGWARRHKNFVYVPVASSEKTVTEAFDGYFVDSLDADVLLAGPPRMMDAAAEVAERKGVSRGRIRHDPIRVTQ